MKLLQCRWSIATCIPPSLSPTFMFIVCGGIGIKHKGSGPVHHDASTKTGNAVFLIRV